MVKWHKADLDSRMYCNLKDGKKITMPRYYKNKIYTEQERERLAFFHKQKFEAQKLLEMKDPNFSENERMKMESVKAEFKRMYNKAELNRHKI